MKRLAAAAAFLALLAGSAAAVILPLRIGFQGKLLDPVTNLPKNGNISMQFRLYDVPTGGTALYTEPSAGSVLVPVNNGVFSYNIGTGALLTADLFRGASAYLGITIVGDAEMLPRQPLSMSAYAFTAMQLVSDASIRVNPGVSYSTFNTAGSLLLDAGVEAATGSFSAQGNTVFTLFSSSGIFMSSGTLLLGSGSSGFDTTMGIFRSVQNGTYALNVSSGIRMTSGTIRMEGPGGIDATYGVKASTGLFANGTNGDYGLVVSSGIIMSSGTMIINGGGGIDARYSVEAGSLTLVEQATDPLPAKPGELYVNSSSGTLKLNSGVGGWMHLGSSYQTLAVTVATGTAPTVAKAAIGTILITPFYLNGPMIVNSMLLNVTTLLGNTGDVGVYTSSGGLALNGGSGTVSTAVGLKSVSPAQANRFLRPGAYYAAVTWNSTTGVIGGSGIGIAGYMPRCGSVLNGGSVLPATIDPNAITNLTYCYRVVLAQ
jgi:hypothetical protein